MKIKIALLQRLAVISALFALSASAARAQTFTSSPQDLMLDFRQVVNGAPGSTDLTIDVGNAANYRGIATPFTVSINAANITGTYGSLNNLLWSVVGAAYPSTAPNPNSVPANTLWVTAARDPLNLNTQTSPWVSKSAFSQGGAAALITGIPTGAASAGTALSSSAATVPDGNSVSYHSYVTDNGNLQGKFQGNIENSTGAAFSGSSRSDLYELQPASGNPNGVYLGYFDLTSAGVLTFVPVPESSTYGIMAGAGLLLVLVRHQFRRQNA
jgi:hypothetical protein